MEQLEGVAAVFCAFENSIFLCAKRDDQILQYSVPELERIRSIEARVCQCLATDGKRMFALLDDDYSGLIDLETGKELWRQRDFTGLRWTLDVDFANDLLCRPSETGAQLLRLSTGEQLAELSDLKIGFPCFDLAHGLLYASGPTCSLSTRRVLCLDGRTLEPRGEVALPLPAEENLLLLKPVSRYLLALSGMADRLAVVEEKQGSAPTAEPRTFKFCEHASACEFVEGGASPLRVLITCETTVLELDFTANLDDA